MSNILINCTYLKKICFIICSPILFQMFHKHIVSTTWKNGTLLLLILYKVWHADNPESSEENTTSAHISGQTGTRLELSRQREQGAVRKKILSVSVCTQSWKPVSRSTDISDSRGKTTTCAPRDPSGVFGTQEPRSSLGEDTSSFLLDLELTLWQSSLYPDTAGKKPVSESADTQAYMRDKPLEGTARLDNTRDN